MFNIHSTLTAILLNVLEKHHVGFDSLLEYPLSKECLSLAGLNTSVEYAHLYAIWNKREFAWGCKPQEVLVRIQLIATNPLLRSLHFSNIKPSLNIFQFLCRGYYVEDFSIRAESLLGLSESALPL